jgi:peptidoglycan hydrolase CwlO-like protein
MIQQLRLDVEDLAETVDEQEITVKKLEHNLKGLKLKLHDSENLLKSKDDILESINK